MNLHPARRALSWQLRRSSLRLGERTLVIGVVNVTPDSFSDGGLYLDPERAVAHALALLDEGADLLDVGAESTRPGSHAGDVGTAAVSADEEQARLLPVIEGILKARPSAILSADTYKAATGQTAIAAGAEIINDVSGFSWDPAMAATCAELRCGVVLMHTRGKPGEWRAQPALAPGSAVAVVREGLAASLEAALSAGISRDAVVLDPGYGFGKRFEENYDLLAHQAELLSLGRPLLAGLSRKSFLGRTLAQNPQSARLLTEGYPTAAARDTASMAAVVTAILGGASIVRVHCVRPAVEAAAIADAVLAARAAAG